MEYLCKCNNCDQLYIDTNPKINAIKFDTSNLILDELIDHKCPNCNTDKYLQDEVYYVLWYDVLGVININDDDEIEEPFLHFPIRTHREDIWHWFEETFDISIAKDLMNL